MGWVIYELLIAKKFTHFGVEVTLSGLAIHTKLIIT